MTQAIWDTISGTDRIAGYLHELGSEGIEDVSPETPTDEFPVEDIPPDGPWRVLHHPVGPCYQWTVG
jgi:hypothetical protein